MEEIAESWLCARRTLSMLNAFSRKENVALPEEAAAILSRAEARFGPWAGEAQLRTPSQKSDSASPLPHLALPGAEQASRAGLSPAANILYAARNAAKSPIIPSYAPSNHVIEHSVQPALSAASSRQQKTSRPRQPSTPVALALSPSPVGYMAASSITAPGASAGIAAIHPTNITPGAVSSSANFGGGFEPALRDSQDWLMRDQSQLAMGFDQWPLYDWHNAASGSMASVNPTGADGLAALPPTWDASGINTTEMSQRSTEPPSHEYAHDNYWYQQR